MVRMRIFSNQCDKDEAAFYVDLGTWKVQLEIKRLDVM